MKKSFDEIIKIIAGINIKPKQFYRYKETGDLYEIESVQWGAGKFKDKIIIGYQKLDCNVITFAKEYSEFIKEFEIDNELSVLVNLL